MRRLAWLLGLAAAFGLGTAAAGWWAVPVVALVAGGVVPRRHRPLIVVPAAAGLAWMLLLARAAQAPGFAGLVGRLDELLGVSSPALHGVTLVFPMITAASAALIASAIAGRRRHTARE